MEDTDMIEYLTVKEMGERWNISSRMVTIYCKEGRIPGAIKKGNLWLLPSSAEKPIDNRVNNGKKQGMLLCQDLDQVKVRDFSC